MILSHSLSVRVVSYQVLLERQILCAFLSAMAITAQCDRVAVKYSCLWKSLDFSNHFKTECFRSTGLKNKSLASKLFVYFSFAY